MKKAESEGHQKVLSETLYPSRDTICTLAFSNFLTGYHANLDFFFFIVRLTSQADRARVNAAKVLLEGEADPLKRNEYEASIANPEMTLGELKKHSSLLSQNLTNGIVNTFQRYFSSLINSAASKRPELISSSQTIKIEEVLRFSKHRDLVASIIDRKINDLSYGGLAEMEKYFDDRLGVKMFSDDRQRDLLRLFIEIRNINVHNGGIVNDLFVSRAGFVDGFSYSKGKRLHVDLTHLTMLSENAMRVALHIDSVVSAKFRLQRKTHKKWKEKKN